MSLEELREKIDAVDDQLVRLFQERMQVAAEIAKYKAERDLPVLQPAREREKLQDVAGKPQRWSILIKCCRQRLL